MEQKNLISLFAGAGGLDLGLESAGFTTIVATELESYACETLRRNKVLCNLHAAQIDDFVQAALEQKCFRRFDKKQRQFFFGRLKTHKAKQPHLQQANIIEGDIRNIASDTFAKFSEGNLFCIAGGPPCQPFSKAGKQKSLDCTKNGDLFYEFVRLVRDLQPEWFIFENVKGITFTKTDVLYLVCKECGSKSIAPFSIRQNFYSHHEKGVCSKCETGNTAWITKNEKGGSLKIIVNEFAKVGYECEYKVLNAADYGAPQMRERLFIVGNRKGINFQWPERTHAKPVNGNGQMSLINFESSTKTWRTMRQVIWPESHPVYGPIDYDTAKLWVKNVVRPHDEPVTWGFDRPSPTIGAHQAAKLAFAPIGVPEKQLYRQQWATKGRKQGDTPPVFVEHEYLSDAELLKLQTFPEWWYLHGTRMQRAFQIGNAVPPILAQAVGEAVLNADKCNDN